MTEWTAFLSDGRSINEKDLFVAGEELPFKKLVRYCVKNNLEITAVTITVDGIRYNSPSLSTRGNFISPLAPKKFWVQHRARFFPVQQISHSFIGLYWRSNDICTTLWIKTDGKLPISWIEVRGVGNSVDAEIDKYYSGEL